MAYFKYSQEANQLSLIGDDPQDLGDGMAFMADTAKEAYQYKAVSYYTYARLRKADPDNIPVNAFARVYKDVIDLGTQPLVNEDGTLLQVKWSDRKGASFLPDVCEVEEDGYVELLEGQDPKFQNLLSEMALNGVGCQVDLTKRDELGRYPVLALAGTLYKNKNFTPVTTLLLDV